MVVVALVENVVVVLLVVLKVVVVERVVLKVVVVDLVVFCEVEKVVVKEVLTVADLLLTE